MITLHPTVHVKKLRDDAVIPVKAHPTDAAYDLCVCEDITLRPGEYVKGGTGVAVAIREGWCVKIYPRSGLGCKGLILKNTVGVIDSSYRGEVKLPLFNSNPTHVWRHSTGPVFGTEMTELVPNTEGVIHIHKGDRVAQMCIELVPDSTFVEVEELDQTERGAGGFGSSGISGGPRI